MLNENGKNEAQTAVKLVSVLKKTAPVYYALGIMRLRIDSAG